MPEMRRRDWKERLRLRCSGLHERPVATRYPFCALHWCLCHSYFFNVTELRSDRCEGCGCFLTPVPSDVELLALAGGARER
jgi:hypothetical protein